MLLSIVHYPGANPILPYDFPAFSEILWTDSHTWALEIDGEVIPGVEYKKKYPSFRIYFSSTHQVYETNLYFNESCLAVITPDSLSGPGKEPPPLIRNLDTLFIPDQEGEDSYPNKKGWLFVLDNPEPGMSLISDRGDDEIVYYSTSRSNIGTRGEYYTIHNLQILGRDSLPLPGINSTYARNVKYMEYVIYDSLNNSGEMIPVWRLEYFRGGTSDDNGIIHDKRGYIDGSGTWTYFLSDKPFPPPTEITLCNSPYWKVSYIDSCEEVTDTIVYAPNYHTITVADDNGDPLPLLQPIVWHTYWTGGIALGEPVDSGIFTFGLFEQNSDRYIEFMDVTDSTVVAACSLLYVDTEDTVYHHLVAAPVKNGSARKKITEYGQTGTLTCRVVNRCDVRFIIANRFPVARASISVCAANGKTVASLPVVLSRAGTHTVTWEGSGKTGLAAGRYICGLQFNGTTVATRPVTIF